MFQLVRTNSNNPDFINLVKDLDVYLAKKDGDEHDFYDQFNSIENIKHVLVCYHRDNPVGCGSFKEYDSHTVEIKRMYTTPNMRGKGVASIILKSLENWALESGYRRSILETGLRQTEAVLFYKKCSYTIIENYGQYRKMDNSICFEKNL